MEPGDSDEPWKTTSFRCTQSSLMIKVTIE
jgi:hypothetical protein